jgi:hypothetical protein
LARADTMPLDDLRMMGRNTAALACDYSTENWDRIVMECFFVVAPSAG